jgi:hypothetical protein
VELTILHNQCEMAARHRYRVRFLRRESSWLLPVELSTDEQDCSVQAVVVEMALELTQQIPYCCVRATALWTRSSKEYCLLALQPGRRMPLLHFPRCEQLPFSQHCHVERDASSTKRLVIVQEPKSVTKYSLRKNATPQISHLKVRIPWFFSCRFKSPLFCMVE